jgi:hypothetical protein
MCTVSFDKEVLNITIHNLYPGLELTSSVYCSNGTTCHVSPDQQVDTINTVEASFGIDSKQKKFEGVLLYKLQRKYATKTDNHLNDGTASSKNTAKNIHLLVVWCVEDERDESYVCLLECTDDFTWDEDKLWTLYKEYNHLFLDDYNYITLTWLTCDGTVMEMRCEVTYGTDYKLNIVISEETGKYSMEKPIEIDLER